MFLFNPILTYTNHYFNNKKLTFTTSIVRLINSKNNLNFEFESITCLLKRVKQTLIIEQNLCCALIQDKQSKNYNLRCNRNRKINTEFCGLHNKHKLKLQVKVKKKCFAITLKGLKCKRVVKNKNYCFQHLKNFKEV